jgi:hypothetical protein
MNSRCQMSDVRQTTESVCSWSMLETLQKWWNVLCMCLTINLSYCDRDEQRIPRSFDAITKSRPADIFKQDGQ